MPTTINPSDQTITQYNIQTGGTTNLLNNVAPSATSGVPVISQGAASQPVFGTVVVAGGGTGQTTLTNHGVLVGAATSAITQLAAGSSGQVLQSGGASADPAYSTATYPATTTVSQILYSSSANVVAGLSTANNGVLATSSSGVPSIDTTNFAVLSTGLQLKGNNANTAPPAGFIGEQIRATVAVGTPISISNNTATNVTSINLTAGIWDVSAICQFKGATVGTLTRFSISTTSVTEGTFGDNLISFPFLSQSPQDVGLSIPSYRITLGSPTTVYMVAFEAYTVGTGSVYGRISATRVG